jgi:hypothetical protein
MITESRIREIVREELDLRSERGFKEWLKGLTRPDYISPAPVSEEVFPKRKKVAKESPTPGQ